MSLSLSELPLEAAHFIALIELVTSGSVSFSVAANQIFPLLIAQPTVSPILLAQRFNLIQERDPTYLQNVVMEVLNRYPEKVVAYKQGKKQLLLMFMGEIMKHSQGKANPNVVRDLLQQALEDECVC